MSEEEPAAAISMVFNRSPPIALSEASSAARASTSCAAAGATDSAHRAASIHSLRSIPSSSVLHERLRNPQELHQVTAQDRSLVRITQERGIQHEIHRDRPVEWHVRTVGNLADAHLCYQVPKAFFGEHHGVHHHLAPHDLARLARVGAVGVGADDARGFSPTEIRGQVAAGVRAADTKPGEFVERAVEDQSREEVGRLERVADDVAEVAAAAQCAVLDDVVRATGMHDDGHAQLGGLGPEGIVFRQRQIVAIHVAADRRAAQAETFDAVLELLRREIGKLQRDRGHGDESIRMRLDPLREALVLRLHDLLREIAIGLVPPETVDGERLHVDAGLVHERQTLRSEELVAAAATGGLGERRVLDNLRCFRDDTVTVDVDDLHAPPGDRDLTPRLLGAYGIERVSEDQCSGRASHRPTEGSPVGHGRLLGARTVLPVEGAVKYAAILLDIYRPQFYWYVLSSRPGARNRGRGDAYDLSRSRRHRSRLVCQHRVARARTESRCSRRAVIDLDGGARWRGPPRLLLCGRELRR